MKSRLLLLLLLPLALAACVCPPVPESWIASDEANINMYHPRLREYIEHDETLTNDEREMLNNGLDLREIRVRKGREALNEDR